MEGKFEALKAGMQQIAAEKAEAERELEEQQGPVGRNSNLTAQQKLEQIEKAALKASKDMDEDDDSGNGYYDKLSRDRKLKRVARRRIVRRNCSRCQHLKKEVQDLQQLARNRQQEIQVLQKHLTQEKVRYNKLFMEYRSKAVGLGVCEGEKEILEEDQLQLVRTCIGDQQEIERLEDIIGSMLTRLSQLGGKQEAEDWVNDYTGLNGYDPRDKKYFD